MFQNNLLMGAAAASSGGASLVSVGNSALFEDAVADGTAGQALTQTFSGSPSSTTTGTFSVWFNVLSDARSTFIQVAPSGVAVQIAIFEKKLYVDLNYSSASHRKQTTQVIRDYNAWYHLVVTFDTSNAIDNDRIRMYLNGERITDLGTYNESIAVNSNICIGAAVSNIIGRYEANHYHFNGYMAECVYLDGQAVNPTSFGAYDSSGLYWTPKSSEDIQGLTFGNNGWYLANKVTNQPQLDFQAGDDNTVANSQISALLHMDGSNDATSTTDSSQYANTVTFAGNAHLDTSVKKFGTASLQLDGNGDYVTIPDSDGLNWGTGDFTVSFSIYFTTIHTISASYTNVMIAKLNAGGGDFLISYKNGTNLYVLCNTTVIDQAYTLSTGQWYQMEISRSGTSVKWFIDGTERGSGTSSFDNDNTDVMAIGASNYAGWRASDRDIAGYMDEIQIIKGTALHTSNFTAPSAAYSDPQTPANNFTNNNTVVTTTHTPTNGEALFNPINTTYTASAGASLSNGNRTFSSASGYRIGVANLNFPKTGKWWVAVEYAASPAIDNTEFVGITRGAGTSYATNSYLTYQQNDYSYCYNNTAIIKGSASSSNVATGLTQLAVGDFMLIAFDADNQTVKWYLENALLYTLDLSSAPDGYYGNDGGWSFAVATYTSGTKPTLVNTANYDYTPPTGYEELNTTNIAAATTRTASDTNKYFQTVLYEGNGAGQRVGAFQPFTNSFTVGNGALFAAENNEVLKRTNGSGGNETKWTFSTWIKFTNAGLAQIIFGSNQPTITPALWLSGNDIYFTLYNGNFYSGGGSYVMNLITDLKLYDTSQWMHLVAKYDSTPSTPSSSSIALYLNGVQITDFSTESYPSQNQVSGWNSANEMIIGTAYNNYLTSSNLAAYMAETVNIDGLALGPDSFGQTDTTTNRWIPKDVSGLTFGTNGFYLNYANSSDVGNDVSGNNNDWTNVNTVTQVSDSPTTNLAILNPNTGSVATLSNGNRTVTSTGASDNMNALSTIPLTGKVYFEFQTSTLGTNCGAGLTSVPYNYNDYPGGDTGSWGWNFAGGTVSYGGATASSAPSTLANGVRGCIALDMDTGSMWTGQVSSGTITWDNSGNPETGANPITTAINTDLTWYALISGRGSSVVTAHFASADWTGSTNRPASFSALAQDNISSSDQFISAFSWIKNRDATDNHMLFDRVRGINKDLHSNDTAAEVTNEQTVQQFLSAGVQIGNDAEVNTANESYVLWNWMMEATGSGTLNEDGSIDSTVLVDTTLGVSVGTYTGNNTAGATVGHGLGVAPELVLYKNRDAAVYWLAYHKDITADSYMFLNSSTAAADANVFNDTYPTSTNLVLGTDIGINSNTVDYVYMAFAPSQFISIGSYIGNGNADGAFVPTLNSLGVPIQPSFFMMKASSRTSPWTIYDTSRLPYNVNTKALEADASTAEQTHSAAILDFDTGGMKMRGTSYYLNQNAATYVYLAIGTPIIDTNGKIIAGR